MWEENLGKVKARRSKNSKPYERPKSILRRVTDSVTGLLPQPSWLANWLQSTSPKKEDDDNEEIKQEQPVPSTSSASNGNSSCQQGLERESFIFRRPPGTSRELYKISVPVPDVLALDSFPEPVVVESTSREQLIQTNGDDDSNSESTSGCSSLLPHPEHKRESRNVEVPSSNVAEPLVINQSSLQIIGSSLSKSLAVDLKNSRGRKTLSLHSFSHDTNMPATPAEEPRLPKAITTGETSGSFFDKNDISLNRSASKRDISLPQLSSFGSKRPRFNVTSFGPTAAEARRSLLNDSVVDSPFYAGRTTYGGASAYRRAALQPSTTLFPYVRNRIQARPASVSLAPPTPSGSVPNTSSSNVVLSSSAQRILQALEAMSTPVRDAKRIPATSNSRRSSSMHDEELSFAGFGLSRRRPHLGPPTSKLSVSTPAQIVARQAPTSIHSQESAPVSSTPISTHAGGKMRMRTTAPARKSASRIQEDEEKDIEGLASVPMPLSSLPNFNFLPPLSVAPTETVVSTSVAISTSSDGLITSAAISVSRPTFIFSAPLVTVSSYQAETTISSKPPSFNFSSPLLVHPTPERITEKEPGQPMELNLKSGSVLEVLRGKTQEGSPVKGKPSMPTVAAPGFGEKFKPPADSWTCSVCCVTNPKDKSSCLACESPVTVTKPASTVPVTTMPVTIGFGDQFKMSSAQWECSVCMVRNMDKDSRCKSCEEPRPGTKTAVTPSSVSAFKFGIQPAQTSTKFRMESSTLSQTLGSLFEPSSQKDDSYTGFRFGVTGEVSKQVEETPGFKFGSTIEPKVTETIPTTVASVEPTSSEKGGFKFGASIEPNKKTDESTSGFKFGYEKKTEETKITTLVTNVSSASTLKPTQLFGFQAAEQITKREGETNILTLDSLGKSETELQVFKVPALFPQVTARTSTVSTSTTPVAKASPIFSFGAASVIPDSRASVLATDSVMDILGKKTAAPDVAGPISSAQTFSFGASDHTKPLFSCGAAEKSSLKLATGTTEKEVEPSVSTSLAPTPTSTSFNFAGVPTTTSTKGLFKPTAVPSFNFGGQTIPQSSTFGIPSTTTTTPAFVLKAGTAAQTSFGLPPGPAVFGVPTAAPPAFSLPTTKVAPATFGLPSTSTGQTAFGLLTTSAVTTAVAGSMGSSVFTFGSTAGGTTTSPSSGTFSFGMTSSSSKAPFSFGTSAPPPYQFPKETPKPASAFGFGPSATTAVNSTISTGSLFSFGSSSVPSVGTTTVSEGPKMQFNFGTSQETATSTAPTFGSFGSSATTKTTTAPFMGFNSSTSSSPAFGEIAPKSSVTPFGAPTPFGSLPPTGFGASAPSSSPASPFSFGAQPPATAAAPPPAFNAGSSFNFGASAPVVPQQPGGLFQFGTAPTPAVTSGFNFASSPGFTTPDASSPGFASSFLGANPFDNTGSAGGPTRKIRKAVRRR